ncbi:MAG: hypothetical protein SCH71_14485 [Desulfobulbaceae bacterium]|nr:hypothetical protein [Desulfobulbaceae bacterium]
MTRKTAIMDSSSAIILCKTGLHILLGEIYEIVLPASVYLEITAKPYAGAGEYKRLAAEGRLRVETNPEKQERPEMVGSAVSDNTEVCRNKR